MGMKRLLLLCAAILLLTGALTGAFAEEGENWDDFFRSAEGRISFTLPLAPDVIEEKDLLEEEARTSGMEYIGWRDKIQLLCSTQEGDLEIHIADLEPMLNQIRADHPDYSEENYQANALMNLAYVTTLVYDGSIVGQPEAKVLEVDGQYFPQLDYWCTFPDDPAVRYHGKGLMDGTRAVLATAPENTTLSRFLEELRPMAEAEAAAFHGREKETLRIGRMEITFPIAPDAAQGEDYEFYDVFTPDYAYITLEYDPITVSNSLLPLMANIEVRNAAKSLGESYVEKGKIVTYTMEQVSNGVWRVFGYVPLKDYLPEDSQRQRMLSIYLTPEGAYLLETEETPAAQALLSSIVFPSP